MIGTNLGSRNQGPSHGWFGRFISSCEGLPCKGPKSRPGSRRTRVRSPFEALSEPFLCWVRKVLARDRVRVCVMASQEEDRESLGNCGRGCSCWFHGVLPRTQILKLVLQDWVNDLGATKIRDNAGHDFLKDTELSEEALIEAYLPVSDVLAYFNQKLPPINKWRVPRLVVGVEPWVSGSVPVGQ